MLARKRVDAAEQKKAAEKGQPPAKAK